MTPPPLLETTSRMNTNYIYLIQSLKDKKFYLGWTTNLRRRLDAHNAGSVRSTKSRKPFKLVFYETYSAPEEAKIRERQSKKNPRMYSFFKKRALLCASAPKGAKEVVG